jgi:hypothetical protein
LKLPITDPAVIRLATLTAAHNQVQAQIAAGKSVDVSGMLAIDNALAEVRAALKPLPNLEIYFVSGVTGIFNCQHCGKRNDIPDYKPLPPPPSPTIVKPENKPEAPSEQAAAIRHS